MAIDVRPFGQLFAEPTRNGLTRPKAVRGFGIKMVIMGELFAHPRLHNAPMDRVPLNESEARKFLLNEGDLLFARQSLVLEGAGKCSLFLKDDEPVTFESHVTRVRLDPCKADPHFYFYYLQSPHGVEAIRSIVEQGAGASGIRGSDLEGLHVQWRPVTEQRVIAHIPRHARRLDRAESADQRDAGGDRAGIVQIMVRRFRSYPRQGRRPRPRPPQAYRRPLTSPLH